MTISKRRKRCHFFDEYGRPVGAGCLKDVDNCPFVHPSESAWDRLPYVSPVYVPRRRHPRSPDRSRQSPTSLVNRISPRHTQDRSSTLSSRHRSPPPSIELRVRADSVASSHSTKGDPLAPKPSATHTPQLQDQSCTNARTMSATQILPTSFPPLPAPPALLSAEKLPPSPELTTEQKRHTWMEYVQLLADSIQQASEVKKLQGDINLLKKIAALSSDESGVGPPKAAVGTKLAALTAQLKELESKKQAAFNRITAADNWPVAPAGDTEDKDSLSKAATYHNELTLAVETINNLLARSASLIPSDTSMGDQGRPQKRRRTDDDGKEEQQETPASAVPTDISDELRDRVLNLHETMINIQNFQTILRNDLTAEYKEYIDTKMDDVTKDAAKDVEAVAEKYNALESNIKISDNDLEELAIDIEKLILDNQAFEVQIAETNQTIKDTIANINHLQQRQLELTNRRDQHAKAIEALQAAVAAHTARQISPPVSPLLPPIDYIVQAVHDPLLDAARSAVKPLLTSTKEDIERLLKERHAEMYQTLWNRLGLTLKVVDTLSARIVPSSSSVTS